MGGASSKHGEINAYKIRIGKAEGKKPHGRKAQMRGYY
jgi:hypothetical protein